MQMRITSCSARVPVNTALVLLLAGGSFAAVPAWCQSPSKVALVLGNANYQHAPPLANPKNDAEDMAALLRRLGFQVTAGLDLTDAAMEDRIRGFSRRARAAKVALFFYAGHGMQVAGVNYLVPVDARLADEADLPFETVALDLVLKRMGGGTNLVFLDACRDNPFARGWAGAGRSTSVGRGLTRVGEAGGSGMFIAFATDPNRIAADGEGRNSPFTAALKRHIETPGLEINGLLTEVRRTVLASTGDVQRPWSNSSLSDPFYFLPSAALPAGRLNATTLAVDAPDPATEMWLQIRETANAQLLEGYLANYPNSRYRMAAAARLDALRGQPFTVVVEPSAARVRILNIEPPYRAGMKLPAGEYRVEASAQGYTTKVEMVAHGSSPTAHRMALSRSGQPFTVVIEPSAARVRILNIEPPYHTGMKLPAGEYRVEASAQGYKTKVEMVAHGSSPTTHRMALSRSGQPFTVVIAPSAARVRILNIESPYRTGMKLPAGEYRVEASAQGYGRKVEVVTHGNSPTVHRVELKKLFEVGKRFRDCPDCPEMVVMPAGQFTMGSRREAGRNRDEGPVHLVTIGAPFAIGSNEVTFAEWDACVADGGCAGYRPSDEGWGRGARPVINVSWEDADQYVGWLSGKTALKYRLPSEAEWEYAARAGTATARYWGDGEAEQCRHANGADRSMEREYPDWVVAPCGDGHAHTAPTDGGFSPNGWGLLHMLGNVWEWTADCWNGNYVGAPIDGSAWTKNCSGELVLRGGSWSNAPKFLRSAARFYRSMGYREKDIGFRVARTLDQ